MQSEVSWPRPIPHQAGQGGRAFNMRESILGVLDEYPRKHRPEPSWTWSRYGSRLHVEGLRFSASPKSVADFSLYEITFGLLQTRENVCGWTTYHQWVCSGVRVMYCVSALIG